MLSISIYYYFALSISSLYKMVCFSVVGTIVFKENLGKIIKRETINNKKVNEAKLSSVMFTLKSINILP